MSLSRPGNVTITSSAKVQHGGKGSKLPTKNLRSTRLSEIPLSWHPHIHQGHDGKVANLEAPWRTLERFQNGVASIFTHICSLDCEFYCMENDLRLTCRNSRGPHRFFQIHSTWIVSLKPLSQTRNEATSSPIVITWSYLQKMSIHRFWFWKKHPHEKGKRRDSNTIRSSGRIREEEYSPIIYWVTFMSSTSWSERSEPRNV